MIEEAKIKVTTELDAKGLEQLRQALRGSKQELTLMTKELDRTSNEYKVLKSAIAEMNATLKLSDNDLKLYAQSLTQVDTKATKTRGGIELFSRQLKIFGGHLSVTKEGVSRVTMGLTEMLSSSNSLTSNLSGSVGTLALYAGAWGAIAYGISKAIDALIDWENENSKQIQMNEQEFKKQQGTENVIQTDTFKGSDASLDKYYKDRDKDREKSKNFFNEIETGERKRQDRIKQEGMSVIDREKLIKSLETDLSNIGDKKTESAKNLVKQLGEQNSLLKKQKIELGLESPDKERGGSRGHTAKTTDLVAALIDQQQTLIGLSKIGESLDIKVLENALQELKLGQALVENDKQRLALKIEIEKTEKSLFEATRKFARGATFQGEDRGLLSRSSIGLRGLTGLSEIVQGLERDKSKSLFDTSQLVLGNIQSMMSVLNIGADTFVGKMLSGFRDASIIIESIKAINSIFNFFKLPFLAEGGTALAGMPHIVGERGPELFVPNTTGRVFNNADTMRMLNMSNHNKNVNNVYVSASITKDGFKAKIEEYNKAKNYIKL